jgi:hypothetical protein
MNIHNLPSVEDAGIEAVKISESVKPELTAQEQALFVSGFQECIKWLEINKINISEWISVTDRLPDEGGDYLVTDGDACFVPEFLEGAQRFVFSGIDFWNNEDVTHWMPLPPPPKK